MKIRFFDISVRKTFYAFASALSVVFSFVFVFVTIPDEAKLYVATCFFGFLLISYVIIWIFANKKKKVSLRIRNTHILITEGDIFNQEGKKIIPVNEYFDTIVDDKIIAKNSLHGKYILNYVNDIAALNKKISSSLGHEAIRGVDQARKVGKKTFYKLGTIFKDGDFWLLAYAKFDKNNKAYLSNRDFAYCYMNMWNEIDKYHAGYTICMPVLGSGGIVRINDNTPQQLLENILWTFRLSGINLGRTAKLKIIVHKTMLDEIDFLKLKNFGD